MSSEKPLVPNNIGLDLRDPVVRAGVEAELRINPNSFADSNVNQIFASMRRYVYYLRARLEALNTHAKIVECSGQVEPATFDL